MDKILFLVSIVLLSSYTSVTETHTLNVGENVGFNSAEEEHFELLYKTSHPRNVIDDQIPKEFDARKHWPQCKTIGEVYNDGNSLVSWAYGIAGVFADRMCIATNGSYNQPLSTEELISCSGINADSRTGSVNDDHVWEYLKNHGVVSGGKYNTNDGCQPSKIPPIGNIPTGLYKNTCEERCYGNNTINYHHDHVKVGHYYSINSVTDIQKELQTYGPVSMVFKVFDNDFFLYKSGVYEKNTKSEFMKWQYAKLIGWGVENGINYWLLVNSWGYEWGQNGLFKIKRGTNECDIETYVHAGRPEQVEETCDIYTSMCINEVHYSKESNLPFFTQHNFTLDTAWKSVGKTIYCRNGTCHGDHTLKIEKSTQIQYGNETFSSTVGNSESISKAITESVSAGFSLLGIQQRGGSTDASKQYGSERSFEVTDENGLTVSYSTSTTNTVGVEEKITCDGVQNEKITIKSRTNMIRLTGNVCVYLRYSEFLKKHVYKCNYVDLKMYPVMNQNIVTELQCHREIVDDRTSQKPPGTSVIYPSTLTSKSQPFIHLPPTTINNSTKTISINQIL